MSAQTIKGQAPNGTYLPILVDDNGKIITSGGGGGGTVESVVAGTNIDVDSTDPANPIVSVETLTTADISDLTATAAELNYTDGVTSAIQTQLDAKRPLAPRTGTVASSATPTINTDNVDFFSITAQTVDITSMTTNLSGTPVEAQRLHIAITGTAARAITWGASFENGATTLPTTTVTTQRLDVLFIWNSVTSKWRCLAAG